MANNHSDRESSAEPGVRKEGFAGLIYRLQQSFVEIIERGFIIHSPRASAKTDRAQRNGSQSLKFRMLVNPLRKPPRQLDVSPDASRNAFHAEVAQREPQLQRPKVAAQRDAVIHKVYGVVALVCFQVFGNKAERP